MKHITDFSGDTYVFAAAGTFDRRDALISVQKLARGVHTIEKSGAVRSGFDTQDSPEERKAKYAAHIESAPLGRSIDDFFARAKFNASVIDGSGRKRNF